MSDVDRAVLDVFETLLAKQGRPLSTFDIDEKYLYVLYLKDVHGLNDAGVVERLDSPLRQHLGVQSDLSGSTVWRKEQALADDPAGRTAIRNAAEVAVYYACVVLDSVPASVLAEHEIPTDDTLEVQTIPRAIEQEAMRNWARWFLDDLTAPLTFHRAGEDDPDEDHQGPEYARYTGLCTHLALQAVAANSGIDTADYFYDRTNIPSGSALLGNIRDLEEATEQDSDDEHPVDDQTPEKSPFWPPEVQRQFAACYERFFTEAGAIGLLDETQVLVVDTTKVATTSDKEITKAVTGGSGSGREPATYGTQSWSYQFLSVINGEAPFIRSVNPIYDMSETQDRLDEQLETAVDGPAIDVNLIICDKGYYKTDVIKACRKHLTDNWVICGQVGGEIADLIEQAPAGEVIPDPAVNVGVPPIQPAPGAFAYPNTNPVSTGRENEELGDFLKDWQKEGGKWQLFTSDDDEDNSHIAYITDMDLTQANMRKIHVLYNQRAAIESMIGQMMDTHAPYTESVDPAVRAYLMNMAGLFYNTHHLIKRSLSREHGVPLSPTGKEVLTAIRDVAFS